MCGGFGGRNAGKVKRKGNVYCLLGVRKAKNVYIDARSEWTGLCLDRQMLDGEYELEE